MLLCFLSTVLYYLFWFYPALYRVLFGNLWYILFIVLIKPQISVKTRHDTERTHLSVGFTSTIRISKHKPD